MAFDQENDSLRRPSLKRKSPTGPLEGCSVGTGDLAVTSLSLSLFLSLCLSVSLHFLSVQPSLLALCFSKL